MNQNLLVWSTSSAFGMGTEGVLLGEEGLGGAGALAARDGGQEMKERFAEWVIGMHIGFVRRTTMALPLPYMA